MTSAMIDDPRGAIDLQESGAGPAILFVPGSCSTGAAWRPVMAQLGDGYRMITTTLPGYGKTAERRSEADSSIGIVAEVIETIVREVDAPCIWSGIRSADWSGWRSRCAAACPLPAYRS